EEEQVGIEAAARDGVREARGGDEREADVPELRRHRGGCSVQLALQPASCGPSGLGPFPVGDDVRVHAHRWVVLRDHVQARAPAAGQSGGPCQRGGVRAAPDHPENDALRPRHHDHPDDEWPDGPATSFSEYPIPGTRKEGAARRTTVGSMSTAAGNLTWTAATEHAELLGAPVAGAIGQVPSARVATIDPELADTAAFCEAYESAPEYSANCVVVAGRRAGETRRAAVLVLATDRADINNVVRRHLD